MYFKCLSIICLLASSLSAYANESCEAMGVVASNYAESAYQLAIDEPELIDNQGLFDTWVMFLSSLLERSEKSGLHAKEFFVVSKIAGSIIIENKKDTVSEVPSKGYAPLFSRMVIRACKDGRS